jgi:intracellular sulfur oxidation DsrE/DsrF family protein
MLTGVGATMAAFAVGSARAAAQAPSGAFQPARHPQDEWLGQVPGRHRTIIDCASASSAGTGLLYANNLFVANRSAYQLNDGDLAIVVCLRHWATGFAFNDAMWAKYGGPISSAVDFVDPRTKQAPSANLLNAAGYGDALTNGGVTIAALVKRGVQFAVCDMATQMIAGEIARATKVDSQMIRRELTANLIPNSHLMAAGVVAVNRAQEYGYTLLTAL